MVRPVPSWSPCSGPSVLPIRCGCSYDPMLSSLDPAPHFALVCLTTSLLEQNYNHSLGLSWNTSFLFVFVCVFLLLFYHADQVCLFYPYFQSTTYFPSSHALLLTILFSIYLTPAFMLQVTRGYGQCVFYAMIYPSPQHRLWDTVSSP